MTGEAWVCKTDKQLDLFVRHVRETWDWSRPLSIKWSAGHARGMGQNALLHAWVREIARHLNRLPGNDHDEETVKTYLKRRFGRVASFPDPVTGEPMPYLISTAKYEKGEMTAFMNSVHAFAADIGCTLSIWGEYDDLRHAA